MNELIEKPGWLETLWNENPGLAERAERTIKELTEKNNHHGRDGRLLQFKETQETEYDYYNSEKRIKQQEDSMKIFTWAIIGMILTIIAVLIWSLII